MTTGTRIQISDPRFGPGRTGTIEHVAWAQWSELYTIRLDRAGWPGGINGVGGGGHGGTGGHSVGWRVDLRRDEFQVIA